MMVTIGPACAADLEGVAALEHRAYSDPWSNDSFDQLVGRDQVFFACARSDAEAGPVGYVVAWFAADQGEIANLAVEPRARRQGIGGALLDAALDEATRRGAAEVFLEVRESNRAARELYAGRGFTEIGRRRGYYRRPPEDAIVLRRALTQEAGE